MRFPIPTTLPLAILMLLTGCGGLPREVSREPSVAFTSPGSTSIGNVFEGEARRHAGKSGFAVLPEPRQAFAARAALAEFAEQTLDVQYYIWSADRIGLTLGERIVNAAERGVRVRFLIDDHEFRKRDSAVAALAAHPKVEVRIFNPAKFRNAKTLNFVMNFGRLNHRMHNKVMVMDNAVAVVGGRNIADEYFGLSEEHNNRDFDVFAAGPIVRDISTTFDQFWNSEAAIPIEAYVREELTMEDFRRQVAELRKNIASREFPWPLDEDLRSLRSRIHQIKRDLVWAPAQVIYDSPWEPGADGADEGKSSVAEWMLSKFDKVEQELLIESAYFVTKRRGKDLAADLESRDVTVRILTNSLASNNVLPAQAGHASHRKKLLRAGVDLYELRPDAHWVRSRAASWGKDATATLHAKVAVFDRKSAFIGSFNFDQRSANINTEAGAFVDSPGLAEALAQVMERDMQPENAWQVLLDDKGKPYWVNSDETVTSQPARDGMQRVMDVIFEVVPKEQN